MDGSRLSSRFSGVGAPVSGTHARGWVSLAPNYARAGQVSALGVPIGGEDPHETDESRPCGLLLLPRLHAPDLAASHHLAVLDRGGHEADEREELCGGDGIRRHAAIVMSETPGGHPPKVLRRQVILSAAGILQPLGQAG